MPALVNLLGGSVTECDVVAKTVEGGVEKGYVRQSDGSYGATKALGQWDVAFPLEDFGAQVRGQLIVPGDADYEEARRIWNYMIDIYHTSYYAAGLGDSMWWSIRGPQRVNRPPNTGWATSCRTDGTSGP